MAVKDLSEVQQRVDAWARGTPYRVWRTQQRLWASDSDRELYRRQVLAQWKRQEQEQKEAAEKRRKGKR